MSLSLYDLQDIDVALGEKIATISPLSDGTIVPVYFEIIQPEWQHERYPSISIHLLGMIPYYDAYWSTQERIVGYHKNSEGNNIEEVYDNQAEHYKLQYDVTIYSKNPFHDRELMYKMALLMGPRPVLRLDVEGYPSLQGFQMHFDSSNWREDDNKDSAEFEEAIYRKIWTYTIEADIYPPKSYVHKVPKSLIWNVYNGIDSDKELDQTIDMDQ